jgi:hypothetical protein
VGRLGLCLLPLGLLRGGSGTGPQTDLPGLLLWVLLG